MSMGPANDDGVAQVLRKDTIRQPTGRLNRPSQVLHWRLTDMGVSAN